MNYIEAICYKCKNLNSKNNVMRCKAFPNGIPNEILIGENKHTKPLKGQKNNIVFEKLNKDS